MPRRECVVLALLASPLLGQIWPEKWSEHTRVKTEPLVVEDQALFAEYGGEAAETAVYNGPAGKFRATAWRLKDATGGLAWFQALRPANAVPVRNQPLACTTPSELWLAEKNYVLAFDGWRPTPSELTSIYALLPRMHGGGGLPVFSTDLPERDRIRNSERHVIGLTSLERFEKRIPGVLAGFEDGAEIALARYHSPGGEYTVAIFNYPTQQVAHAHAAEFEKLDGWVVVRSGPYLAVALMPPDPVAARKLLSGVRYSANFTWNEAGLPSKMPPVGAMLVAIFQLTGLVLVGCVGGGALFAVFRMLQRRRDMAAQGTESTMTFLHIPDE